MVTLDEATSALREIEGDLAQPTRGGDDSLQLADRIRVIRVLLAKQSTRWVSPTEARRLLGATSADTVKALLRMGLLRSRNAVSGRTEVMLEDVLREREAREELLAIGGDDLTGEELEALHATQPGSNPWERGQPDSGR